MFILAISGGVIQRQNVQKFKKGISLPYTKPRTPKLFVEAYI